MKAKEYNTTASPRTENIVVTPNGNTAGASIIAVIQAVYVFEPWHKLYGGSSDDNFIMTYHFGDGYILVGNTKSNDGDVTGLHGNIDIWAMRINSVGEILWKKTYGGSGVDEARAFMEDVGSKFLIVGKTTSNDGDVTGAQGSDDGWVLLINAVDGNIVWQKTFGSNLAGSFFSVTMADGGYLLSGVKGTDAWLYKMNFSGDLIWEHTYGSSGNEMAISVTPTSDKGAIATGYTDAMAADGDVPATHGMLDVWAFKVDEQGTLEWSKTFGGSGTDDFTFVGPEEGTGKFRLVGYTTSSDGDVTKNQGGRDAWYMQIVGNGDVLWQKTFGGSGDDYGTGIYQIGNVHFVATGSSASNDGDVSGVHGAMDAWMFTF